MSSYPNPIQEVCKTLAATLFLSFSLLYCGGAPQTFTQTLTFKKNSVPFLNTSCSTQIQIINSETIGFTLVFLSATFNDASDKTYQIILDQKQVQGAFSPVFLNKGGISSGNVKFDLQDAGLTPPISGTVVVVGLSGQDVANFVGNFTCG